MWNAKMTKKKLKRCKERRRKRKQLHGTILMITKP